MSLSQTSGLTEETMDRLKAEYMRTQLEKAQLAQQQTAYNVHQAHINAHQQAISNQGLTLTTSGTSSSWISPYAQQTPIPVTIPEEKLDEGAWDVPISQLVDLWIVRYGSKWVNEAELDEFYSVAAKRLKRLNKVEQHYVNASDVYRIVE